MKSTRVALIAAFSLLISLPPSPSQTESDAERGNLYSLALKASILQMEKDWGHLGRSALENEIPINYRHVIVYKDPMITDGLATAFDEHTIEYLNNDELLKRYRKLKKSFAVLKISPIRNEGAALKVVVAVYWFSYEHKRKMFAYSDWSDVRFQFDCGQGRFEVKSVKLGGI